MPKISDARRAARRDQIVRAAMVRVAAEGLHRTTMADVVRESGLSAGAVYAYFGAKDDLILAVADRTIGAVDHAVDAVLAISPVPPLPEMVELLTREMLGQAAEAGVDLERVAVAVWAEVARDEAVRALAAARFAHVRERYADLVRAQQKAGRLGADEDPEPIARALFGLMPGFLLQRLLSPGVTPSSYAAAVAGLTRIAAGR